MKIKCNAGHCKNYSKEHGCILDDISLDFNWDYEGYGCYCSNFSELKEYKRKFYKIRKLKDDEFLIIQTDCMEVPTNYIEDIAEDIKDFFKVGDKITLIIDTLIYRYSARDENRFFKTIYDYNNDDIEKYEILDNSNKYNINPRILKYTCDYLREEYKLSEEKHGFLCKEVVKMILKGMNI